MTPMLSLALVLVLATSSIQLPPARATGTAEARRDPITVRGCVEGRRLRVLSHDMTDLVGIRDWRLKGSRAMLDALKDEKDGYFELSGLVERAALDRLDTQRKRKLGDKTTVSLGASAEQRRGEQTRPEVPELVVEAFTRLDDTCPAR
jgi:hypothetical protein